MRITATKAKAIHILLAMSTHPSIVHYPCDGYPPHCPTAPSPWRDAHTQRPREGACTHPAPHR